MNQTQAIAEGIRSNFAKVAAAPAFGERLWLTVYASGHPHGLERLANELAQDGWVNVGGWEGGFIYPKLEVAKRADDLAEAALKAHQLATNHGIQILNLDADSASEVDRSEFISLYRSFL